MATIKAKKDTHGAKPSVVRSRVRVHKHKDEGQVSNKIVPMEAPPPPKKPTVMAATLAMILGRAPGEAFVPKGDRRVGNPAKPELSPARKLELVRLSESEFNNLSPTDRTEAVQAFCEWDAGGLQRWQLAIRHKVTVDTPEAHAMRQLVQHDTDAASSLERAEGARRPSPSPFIRELGDGFEDAAMA